MGKKISKVFLQS